MIDHTTELCHINVLFVMPILKIRFCYRRPESFRFMASIKNRHVRAPGAILLTLINVNLSTEHGHVFTSIILCGMKLLIHSQTVTWWDNGSWMENATTLSSRHCSLFACRVGYFVTFHEKYSISKYSLITCIVEFVWSLILLQKVAAWDCLTILLNCFVKPELC